MDSIPIRSCRLPPYNSQISAIERDLSVILRATREVKNTLVLVNRLPPEVLSRALEHRASEETLIKATHICQYWRSTLTSSPSLWTHLWFPSDKNVDRALTYLERSKSVPIHVRITSGFSESLEAFQHLTPHLARMRSCSIQGTNVDIHGLFARFRNSTPSLTRLEIYSDGISIPIFGDLPSGLRPSFEHPFPLHNLTEVQLSLKPDAPELNISALFRFLSYSPRLQDIYIIIISGEVLYDDTLDQVVTLDSLVRLDYTGSSVDRILPCLRLARLRQLRVSSRSDRVQNLADILPNGGRFLLAGATEMSYYSDPPFYMVGLSGEGISVSLALYRPVTGTAPTDWLSDETWIPFGRIETLTVGGRSVAPNLPINIFQNLGVLRATLECIPSTGGFWRLLFQGEEISCRSLREVRYTYQGSLGPLIRLAKERKRVGYQLGLVQLFTGDEPDLDRVAELREHVVEVQFSKL